MNTFKWLLKREYWENKGGFMRAPLVAGIIFLVISSMAIIAGEVARQKFSHHAGNPQINGIELNHLTEKLTDQQKIELGGGLDVGLILAGSWPMAVLAFVVFFYCLGALYDDRRDRSVLFWKSLPISDSNTVLSKLASAVLVAPVMAAVAAIATSLGFLILLSLYVSFHGINPFGLIWGPASPLKVFFQFIASVPVYALWALPTVGWLLLMSAWAKSKPFLWAVMLPVFAGILVSWFDIMEVFSLHSSWFWTNVTGRLLLGTVPGMDLIYRGAQGGDLHGVRVHGPEDIAGMFSPANTWATLATPDLWIGVAAGALMIYAAIYLRRQREIAD